MLKWKKTLAAVVFFTQITVILHFKDIPLHQYIEFILPWIKTIIMGPLEYIVVYQSDWELYLTPFVYGLVTLGIYALYTWLIEDWGRNWVFPIYTTHIIWIIARVCTPEEYLLMNFSSLVSKLF